MELSLNKLCFIYKISNFVICNSPNMDIDIMAKFLIMQYATEQYFNMLTNFEDGEIEKLNNSIIGATDEEKFNKKIEFDKIIHDRLEKLYTVHEFEFFSFNEFKRLIYSVLSISGPLIIKDVQYDSRGVVDLIYKFLVNEDNKKI